VRNVSSGLKARSIILESIESRPFTAVEIAKEAPLSYSVVMHHLRLLRNEGTVQCRGNRPYSWMSSGLGQKRLT
jgi:predicted transcriptional regulator